jgi:Tol biopolymer transport system component
VLWSAKPDGSDLRRVSQPGIDGLFEDYHARYSPDGSYLIFVRVDNVAGQVAQFRMNSDGSQVRQLTPWDLNADTADLSQATSGPTKDLLVFESYGHGDPPPGAVEDVETVPTTCLSVEQCTPLIRNLTANGDGPKDSDNPTWSPDGTRIAFVEFTAPPKAHGLEYADVLTMAANGEDRHRVSHTPTWNFRPDW